FTDADPAANLDQWADSVGTAGWQNGDLNKNNSLYAEGEAVPFHTILTNLTAGVHYTISIQWEVSKASTHAYDYLVNYNFANLPSVPDPLAGSSLTGSPVLSPVIPKDPHITTGSGAAFTITQAAGHFALWGGPWGAPALGLGH